MKRKKRLLACLLTAVLLLPLVPQQRVRAAERAVAEPIKVSDGVTLDIAVNPSHICTEYDGKIWTDKSVSASGEMFAADNGYTLAADEFEVALSAISQTFPVSDTQQMTKKKANVVFAIDVSSSMTNNHLMVNGVSRTRLQILQQVGQDFVDSLAAFGDDYTIHISIVLYAGQSLVYQKWIELNDDTLATVKNKIANVQIPNASTCSGVTGNGISNTNSQAGAYMARLMYDDDYAVALNRPDNYAEEYTNNFTIFMTDGAPNRYYSGASTGTPGDSSSAGITDIAVGYDAVHDIYYTVPSGITRIINSTDYKKMAAYTLLQEVEAMQQINNSVVFSLGLGEWFVDEGETSGFATGVNLCQLVAAVGNATLDPSNGAVITADYAWNHYLGYDVPDGTMPGTNPNFPPDPIADAARFNNGSYTAINQGTGPTYYFSNMQAMLDAMNLPQLTDTFVDAKTGSTYTKQAAFCRTVLRAEDARFTTLDACGIPLVPADVLSQVTYYYAGNTAEKFSASMEDIAVAISSSFENYVTSTAGTDDPFVDGLIRFRDTLGIGMELKQFLGVNFNGEFCNCVDESQYLSNYENQTWTELGLEQFNYWCEEMRFAYGAPINREIIDTLIATSTAGGDIYYNSDADCRSMLTMYTRYVPATGIYQYLAPYYTLDGSIASPPAVATHVTRDILVVNEVSGEVVVGEGTSLMYMQMGWSINLTTGQNTIVLNIPASLLPVRSVLTTNGIAHLVNDPGPVSMVYTVGLRDDLNEELLEQNASTDAEGNTLYSFYSNHWRSPEELALSDDDTSTVTFTPSELSPYYQATADRLLYVEDGAGSYRPAVAADGAPYYLHKTFYDANGPENEYHRMDAFYPDAAPVLMTKDGTENFYVPAGSLRYDSITEYDRLKSEVSDGNLSQSSPYAYDAVYTRDAKGNVLVHSHLGNNGLLRIGESTVEDCVVVDYGLPMEINLVGFDSLTAASEPIATAVGLTQDSTDSARVSLAHGTLTVHNGALRYEPQSIQFDEADTAHFLCKAKLNGLLTLCKGTIHVVPANNLYFEESFLSFTDAQGAVWSVQGAAASAVQSSENILYGYDDAYAQNAATPDSLGCSRMATVSDPLVQPTAVFTFTGTGFDLYSRTGADCGVMLVEIRAESATGTLQKVLIADNYLNADTLYQLPVVHAMCAAYGTYYVKISAYYNKAFDHALSKSAPTPELIRSQLGYGREVELCYFGTWEQTARTPAASVAGQYQVYLDGIRIYQPLGENLTAQDGVAYTAYLEAGELNARFVQLRGNLLGAQSWSENGSIAIEGAVYLAGTDSNTQAGNNLAHTGLYLGSSGQLRTDANGALLDAEGEPLVLVEEGTERTVYYYSGEVTETVQPDGLTAYTDADGNPMTTRLYTLQGQNTRVYLTVQQEKTLQLWWYDDVYATDSPENEVYLRNGQAIAFEVAPSDSVQMSLKSPNGQAVQLCVYDTVNSAWVQLPAVSSSTEQYADLSAWIHDGVCIVKCAAVSPTAILSLGNVKLLGQSPAPSALRSTTALVYAAQVALANEAVLHFHSYVADSTAPTCLEQGYTTYTCACGESYVDDYVQALGHTEQADFLVPATCTERGKTAGSHCSLCNEVLTAQTEISALGHDLTVITGTDFFYTYYKCSRCDETKLAENAPAKFEDSPSKAYADVTDSWYRNAADYTISAGIMTGTDKNTFAPNTKMSRAMLVSVLYRLEGSNKVEKPSKSFTDVPADAWYTDAVLWAAENEIVKGTGDGTTFSPNADITREQIALILYNYCKTYKKLDVSKTDDLKAFADADKVSTWAADAVKWAIAEKLIAGRTDDGKTELAPGSNAMRCEVAVILANLAKNITIPQQR